MWLQRFHKGMERCIMPIPKNGVLSSSILVLTSYPMAEHCAPPINPITSMTLQGQALPTLTTIVYHHRNHNTTDHRDVS